MEDFLGVIRIGRHKNVKRRALFDLDRQFAGGTDRCFTTHAGFFGKRFHKRLHSELHIRRYSNGNGGRRLFLLIAFCRSISTGARQQEAGRPQVVRCCFHFTRFVFKYQSKIKRSPFSNGKGAGEGGRASYRAPVAWVLALPALRLRGFGSSNPHRLNYVLHKGGAFSAEEALALYAELQAVRGLARAFLAAPSEAALRELLGDARIRPTKLLGPECWELVAAVGRGDAESLERVSVAVRELEKGLEVG